MAAYRARKYAYRMKFKINIGLHIKPNNKGKDVAEEVGIRLRVSWAGLRCDIRSGFVIAPSKWDPVNNCVKLGNKNSHGETAGAINRGVISLSGLIEEVLTRFELDNKRLLRSRNLRRRLTLPPDVPNPKKRSRNKSR